MLCEEMQQNMGMVPISAEKERMTVMRNHIFSKVMEAQKINTRR